MVNYRSVAGILAVVTIVFAGLSGYLFLAPPSSPAQTTTTVSTSISRVSTTILNTLTSTATTVIGSTSTLLSTVTSTASTTLISTATTTATSTVTGPFTVNLAYKAGTGLYMTNQTGFTLYFRATDPGNGTSTCTGGCVTVWPLFYAAPGTITVPPGLSTSSFGVVTRSDGLKQTMYNGYPLYYYVNDKTSGQIAGQGKGNFYPCCSVDQTTSTTSTSTVSTTTTTTSATTTGAVATAKVSIPSGTGSSMSLNFSPTTITVMIGVNNTILWTNNDSVTHTITSSSVPAGATSFDDGAIAPGGTFSVTLTVAGTYQYYCQIHPWMSATIVVEP